MKKERLKQKKGITLIALVVTIVVLLILAGITITTLFGENGVINAARRASDETNKADKDTEQGIKDLEGSMADAFTGSEVKKGELVPIETKYKMYRDSSGSAPIPGGYCVVKDSETDTSNKNNIGSGLVISDRAGDTLDNEPIEINGESARGNQFVWVPVPDVTTIYGTDSNGKKSGKLYKFGELHTNGVSGSYETYNEPKPLNWSETNGVMKITNIDSNHEPNALRKNGGYTYDNSFTYYYFGISLDEFEIELETSFDSMVESVRKYKGFYIGRYETGNVSSTDTTLKAVIQKGAKVSGPNWYCQYIGIKNISRDNSNVTTSMIWGCLFDRTLEWIVETNSKEDGTKDYTIVTDSSGSWGNYYDSTGAAATNSGSQQPAGTNPAWQKNHIYDLAGNAFESTIEADNHYNRRITRRWRCWF